MDNGILILRPTLLIHVRLSCCMYMFLNLYCAYTEKTGQRLPLFSNHLSSFSPRSDLFCARAD